MPRFYLDIEYGDGTRCQDLDGAVFFDAEAAKAEARKSLQELLAEAIIHDADPAAKILVWDEYGRPVATIGSRDVLPARLLAELAHIS